MPIEIGLFGRYAPGVGLRRRKGCLFGRRRPTVGRRLSRRLKSASQGAARQASAFADAKGFLGRRRPTVGRRLSRRLKSASSSAMRRASAFADAKGFQGFLGRRRPTVGRRLSRRLKSASSGAARRASAFADAEDAFLVGAGRPLAGGLWRPNSFGVRAGRRPKALMPIEIGLFGRYAPGVGLRRRKGCLFGRRRPTIGRRPLEAEFIRRAGWSLAEGFRAD